MTTIRQRFQCAGHTAAEWSAITTVPLEREICLETDTLRLKIGDGVNVYDDLDYLQIDVGDIIGLAAIALSGSAADLTTGTIPSGRMPAHTGDVTSGAGSVGLTLATVNADVGSFGGAGKTIAATVNGKGLVTAFAEMPIAITASQVTDFAAAGGALFQPLDGDLTALAALTGTSTIYYRSAANTWSAVTIGGNLGFSGGTLGSSLGTMATQAASAVAITGGAGAFTTSLGLTNNQNATTTFAVGNSDTTNSSSRGQVTISGGTVGLRHLAINGDAGYAGTTTAHDYIFQRNNTEKMRLTSVGIDVTGEARCDTFRIDATPTAATPTPTHTFPVNINGTVYRVPCVI